MTIINPKQKRRPIEGVKYYFDLFLLYNYRNFCDLMASISYFTCNWLVNCSGDLLHITWSMKERNPSITNRKNSLRKGKHKQHCKAAILQKNKRRKYFSPSVGREEQKGWTLNHSLEANRRCRPRPGTRLPNRVQGCDGRFSNDTFQPPCPYCLQVLIISFNSKRGALLLLEAIYLPDLGLTGQLPPV